MQTKPKSEIRSYRDLPDFVNGVVECGPKVKACMALQLTVLQAVCEVGDCACLLLEAL